MNDRPVVLVIHESGSKEFCMIDYVTGRIFGSIGYVAVGGDIEKARDRLYKRGC